MPSLSPNQARLEKKQIRASKIIQSFELLSKEFDYIVVEGIGGALVPFNTRRLVIDIASDLDLPVLIVAQNKLGAINHTVLTIEAVQKRGMRIVGVIFNGQCEKDDEIILKDNPEIVRLLTNTKILGSLSWLEDEKLLYEAFIPIGDRIYNNLERK